MRARRDRFHCVLFKCQVVKLERRAARRKWLSIFAISIFLNLQGKRNFGGREVSTVQVKIIAAFLDFYKSGRLDRKRNLYQGGERRSKRKRGSGWSNENYPKCGNTQTGCGSENQRSNFSVYPHLGLGG